MWNITSLFALLIVAQATELQDFYGDWIDVAVYPKPLSSSKNVPMCIRFNFAKSPDNMQCTYDDGRNSTLLKVSMTSDNGDLLLGYQLALRVVDTSAEVMQALNIGFKCGDNVVDEIEHAVARLVDKNYFIFYRNLSEIYRSPVYHNSATLFGKNVVSADKLYNVTMGIEELRNREGAVMCSTENYGGFKNPVKWG